MQQSSIWTRPPGAGVNGLRIGLLGGSFNPAHDGHLHLSLTALKVLKLDYVWWLVSPQNPLKDAADMAKGMDELAEKYPPKKAEGAPALPVTLNAKVGLAVAAGDLQPLVVVLADSAKRREELEARVAELAWDKAFAGRLTYATAATTKDIPKVEKRTIKEGILLIEPDIFGAGGKVVKEVPFDEVAKQLADAMRETLKAHLRTEKNRRTLATLGLKEGIFYETGIPVSGKGEAADRERYKKQLDLKKKPD